MTDIAQLWLPDAKKTQLAGKSLAHSLYSLPVTIILKGDLGAGKTTFLQGFAKKLGISQHLTSPTYALEQRYQTLKHGELLHLDCYRLTEQQAQEIAESSDNHDGIRCIEWGERISANIDYPHLVIKLDDECDKGRNLEIEFNDIPLPSREDIENWRSEMKLPEHIAQHCDAVANFAEELSRKLIVKGVIVRPLAVKRSAQLHDLMRFIDFRFGSSSGNREQPQEVLNLWNEWINKYKGHTHETVCAMVIREKGYPQIAQIVESHGLNVENPPNMTIEQKILFYADKRVVMTKVVSLEERFADFRERYAGGKETEFATRWYEISKGIEEELLH
ncbi:tRNA (adenosine(37)-N6)-threonylcarbamoyltransferase complex ATPase subunit type 1 TsaE [Patescibacteria group bacterium]|nr:tRNA (adenosine(37)-N6)-threonylcarbamoyltransferase complex ATPase subunit type 1 TsaE [Patescibacteria group bacterium]MBU1123869.1 tRNA (adenosine(37)-N6)-threonylcarbamoyltransferase complex ATPase subunit type 1 TsaE [Patescibacteria group bacterium]MBU1910956.1 tRNA (adenosine(37)-N6)-threonylcarbamoyltransferase complex ATPase subunit type 1 TsaE [Patescibacteria group bacterium]